MKKFVFLIFFFLIASTASAYDFNTAMDHFRTKNYTLSAMEFKEGCYKYKDMKACYQLAKSYVHGYGVKRDYKKARELYTEACNAGIGYACNNLGILINEGLGGKKDIKKAVKLYKLACDKYYVREGCFNAAETYKNGGLWGIWYRKDECSYFIKAYLLGPDPRTLHDLREFLHTSPGLIWCHKIMSGSYENWEKKFWNYVVLGGKMRDDPEILRWEILHY